MACVTAALVAAPLWIIAVGGMADSNGTRNWIGCIAAASPVLAIAALIVTTPPDAIRLPPRRSVYVLTAGTAWLVAWHVAVIEPNTAAVFLALALPVAAAAVAAAFVRLRHTPWWAAVALWHPAFVGPLALPLAVSAPLALAAAVALSIFAAARRPELTP